MPQAHYIICADSTAVDQATNLVSLFHVLEGYTQTEIPPEEAGDAPAAHPAGHMSARPEFIGVCVWMRNEGDSPEQEYEFETLATAPGAEERRMSEGTFQFAKPFYRFIARFVVNTPWKESGNFVFTNRIRKVGDAEWLTQQFLIPIMIQRGNDRPAP